MDGLETLLKEEEHRLLAIKQVVNARLDTAPKGTLRITNCAGRPQFMLCTDETTKIKPYGEYISKSKHELISQLAQKSYDKKVKKLVERRIKQLETICSEYKDTEIMQIYDSMNDIRKSMVIPVEPTWEQRLEKWKSVPYIGKSFGKDVLEIYTKKGERVRSKSER